MKRFGIILLGLALVFAQPLAAQDYAPDLQHGSIFQYTFGKASPVRADWAGWRVGPHSAKVGHVAWNSPTAPSFTLYCVDFDNRISAGNQINARVSTLGTGDIGATRLGMANAKEALFRYQAAAWLASQYVVAGPTHWSAIQTVIWDLTSLNSFSRGNTANMTGPGGTNWFQAMLAARDAGWVGMNFDEWHVLTAYDATGQRMVSKQEMLTQTQSVVPEPQTYVLLFSGLIFMMVFGRRRMKEQGYF